MSVTDHRAAAPSSLRVCVLTVSDTRSLDTDVSGRVIADLLVAAGHQIINRKVVQDDPVALTQFILANTANSQVDAIITTGGTGIAARDSTHDAVTSILDKRLDGFGELFRMLSFAEIGAAAMLSRACAGVIRRSAIFVLPGSEAAVRLAMDRLILPELGHIIHELRK